MKATGAITEVFLNAAIARMGFLKAACVSILPSYMFQKRSEIVHIATSSFQKLYSNWDYGNSISFKPIDIKLENISGFQQNQAN
jgi:hypothetical protein